jgi:predicted nucleic acid-binding protein
MPPTRRAFLDASVLYPVSLRNLLMRLTIDDLYQARWSAHVHEEWIRAVLRDRPDLSVAQLHAVRDGMDAHAADAVVVDYEHLIPTLELPDPDDRHVLAAAIVCGANIIVTHNLRDFPENVLDPYNIEAQHPDEFVYNLLNVAPAVVLTAVQKQQARLKRPPVSMSELMGTFERLGLIDTVAGLRRLMR